MLVSILGVSPALCHSNSFPSTGENVHLLPPTPTHGHFTDGSIAASSTGIVSLKVDYKLIAMLYE